MFKEKKVSRASCFVVCRVSTLDRVFIHFSLPYWLLSYEGFKANNCSNSEAEGRRQN